MEQYLLGIDVGTTGTKAMLFSATGELIGNAYQGYPLSNPQVGFSEQNAEDWWNAVVETVREICTDPEVQPPADGNPRPTSEPDVMHHVVLMRYTLNAFAGLDVEEFGK